MAKRIVIADDEDGITELLAMRLADEGYECLVARDGAAAWELVRAAGPALVLLDIRMPGLTGWEIAQRITGDPSTRHIPFVFLTAADQVAEARHGMALGAARFVVKPFRLPVIVDLVAELAGDP